jgi:hypothetical protein
MSPAELYAGLCMLKNGEGNTRVLLLDVRPMEDYVQGHLRWCGHNTSLEDSSSGLVHIEPDYITEG